MAIMVSMSGLDLSFMQDEPKEKHCKTHNWRYCTDECQECKSAKIAKAKKK
jgi:hypothetical protein